MTPDRQNLPDQPLLGSVGTVLFPFLRALGHDINSPLTGILGYSQLLTETLPEDSPDRADVEEILRCAEQCRELVAILGRLSRPEASAAASNLEELLSDVEHLARAVGRKHGVELQLNREGELPASVSGNPWVLRSGLLALCSAGITRTASGQTLKATAEGVSPDVRVSLACTDGPETQTEGPHPGQLSSLERAREILASQGVDVTEHRSGEGLVLEAVLKGSG